MNDYSKPEEVFKHLQHVKSTYGVDLTKPFTSTRDKYSVSIYYLNNLIWYMNTKPFDKKIDDFLKEDKELDK